MTISEAVSLTYLLATGKASAPSITKRSQIIGLLDYFQRRWSRELEVDWNSLYDPAFSLGTVTATDTFDLDTSSIRKLSDREGDTVRVVWSDGVGYTDYDIVNADTLKDYSYGVNKENPVGWYCAQVGSQLVFNHTFTTTDSQYGGEIFVPVYAFTDDITDTNPASDEVQVDDPDWLCARAAAEVVRNNVVLRPRYPELLAEANEIMTRMKSDNDGQVSVISRPWHPPSGIGQDSAWS